MAVATTSRWATPSPPGSARGTCSGYNPGMVSRGTIIALAIVGLLAACGSRTERDLAGSGTEGPSGSAGAGGTASSSGSGGGAGSPSSSACGSAVVYGLEDETQVVHLALSELPISEPSPDQIIVLDTTTLGGAAERSPENIYSFVERRQPEAPLEIVQCIYSANRTSAPVSRWLSDDVTTISRTELDEIFDSGGWPLFHETRAAGYYTISKPVFYGEFALIHVEYRCNGLCGHGVLVLLRRGDAWSVDAIAVTYEA
jgi:hypothetical protein